MWCALAMVEAFAAGVGLTLLLEGALICWLVGANWKFWTYKPR